MRHSYILIFLLSSIIIQAINVETEVRKAFSKEDILAFDIAHKYGDISYSIIESDSDSIVVKAILIAEVSDIADTSSLSVLDIIIEENDSTIQLENRLLGNNSGALYSLDFVIYGPETIDLKINQQIGNTILPALTGQKDINIGYGNLITPSAVGNKNAPAKIVVSYGKLSCDSLQNINLEFNNTESNINYVSNASVKSTFSILNINESDSISFISDGDRFSIQNSGIIKVNGYRSIINIDTLIKRSVFELDKGKLNIRYISELFEELNADLTEVESNLSFAKNAGFYFNAAVNEGIVSFKEKDNIRRIDDVEIDTYMGDLGSHNQKKSRFTLINNQSKVKITRAD